MTIEAKSDKLAIVANMPITFEGSPLPRIEVAKKGPTAMPKNLAELRKPIAVPLLAVPLPPRRKGGIPAWMAPTATLRAINWVGAVTKAVMKIAPEATNETSGSFLSVTILGRRGVAIAKATPLRVVVNVV